MMKKHVFFEHSSRIVVSALQKHTEFKLIRRIPKGFVPITWTTQAVLILDQKQL